MHILPKQAEGSILRLQKIANSNKLKVGAYKYHDSTLNKYNEKGVHITIETRINKYQI